MPAQAVVEGYLDTGDDPGEFQYWVEREKLDRVFRFPEGNRDLRMNRDGVLGVVTGVGTAKAAATIMALGLDPRFDLRKAYWLVAGIAGIDRGLTNEWQPKSFPGCCTRKQICARGIVRKSSPKDSALWHIPFKENWPA